MQEVGGSIPPGSTKIRKRLGWKRPGLFAYFRRRPRNGPSRSLRGRPAPLVNAAWPLGPQPSAAAADLERFAHVFVIVEENHGYSQITGNPQAPDINRLAAEYGSATNFFAGVYPSAPNHIAIQAGSTFGIRDDDAYSCTPGKTDAICPKSARPG